MLLFVIGTNRKSFIYNNVYSCSHIGISAGFWYIYHLLHISRIVLKYLICFLYAHGPYQMKTFFIEIFTFMYIHLSSWCQPTCIWALLLCIYLAHLTNMPYYTYVINKSGFFEAHWKWVDAMIELNWTRLDAKTWFYCTRN